MNIGGGDEGEEEEDQREFTSFNREIVRNISEKDVESEHLKNVIISLSSKIVTTNDLEKEIDTFTKTVRHHEEARTSLQRQLGDAGSQAQERSEETKRREVELNNEINDLNARGDNLMGIIRERVQDIHERDFTISQKEKEINVQNLKLQNLSEMKNLNEKYADQVNNAEQARIDLQGKFTK